MFFSEVLFAEVMQVLQKLSMPVAVRLAVTTNCPVLVHALRNIDERYHIYNTIHM